MATDQFLKIGDLKAESRDDKHKEWIDVLSWSWGMSQSGTMHMGGGGGSGKVTVQDISFVKPLDKSSTDLMMACCNGKHFKEATLVCRKAGEKPLEYLKIKMEDVIITSLSTGGSSGESQLTENVTLNFAKVNIDYVEQKHDGSEGAKPQMKWDIEANKPM